MIYAALLILTALILYVTVTKILLTADELYLKKKRQKELETPKERNKEQKIVYPDTKTAEEQERIYQSVLKTAQKRHSNDEAIVSVAYARENYSLVVVNIKKRFADLLTVKTATSQEKYRKQENGHYDIEHDFAYGEKAREIVDSHKEINKKILDAAKKILDFNKGIESRDKMDAHQEDISWFTNSEYYDAINPEYEIIEEKQTLRKRRQDLKGNVSFRGFTKERFINLNDKITKVIESIKYIRFAFANSMLDDETFSVRHGGYIETFDCDLPRTNKNDGFTRNLLAAATTLADLIDYEEKTWQGIVSNFGIVKTGVEGEKAVANRLSEFKQYEVINGANLPIVNPKDEAEEARGSFECDNIVCTGNGIFVLEVKNYTSGALDITKDGLLVHRNKSGAVIEDERADAITQCEEHVALLSRLLNESLPLNGEFEDWNGYIQGVIVIPNEGLEINNESDYPVLRLSMLNHFLKKNGSCVDTGTVKEAAGIIKDNLQEPKRFPFPNQFSYLSDGKAEELEGILDEFISLIREKSLSTNKEMCPEIEECIKNDYKIDPDVTVEKATRPADREHLFKELVFKIIP